MTDISAVNGVASVERSSASGLASNQQFSTDLFMQLLVTQLRYQDPMSEGQDTGEMVTQLSLFTLLEQVVSLQSTVEDLAHLQANQQALNLLNRQVEVVGNDGNLQSGTVSAVDFRSAGSFVVVNNFEFPLSSVIRVEGGSSDND